MFVAVVVIVWEWWLGLVGLALVGAIVRGPTLSNGLRNLWRWMEPVYARLWGFVQGFSREARAEDAYERGDRAKVLRLTARMLRHDPEDDVAWYLRVLVHVDEGRVETAEREIVPVFAALLNPAAPAFVLAKAWRDREDAARSLHWFGRATIDPQFPIYFRLDPDAAEVRAWLERQHPREVAHLLQAATGRTLAALSGNGHRGTNLG